MADPTTTAAVAAAGAAGAAQQMGLPPQEVIVWALLGGLASLWISRQAEAGVSWRAAGAMLAQVLVSASAGIVLSTLLLHVAPRYTWLEPIDRAPPWALAALLAALATKVGPWAAQTLARWLGARAGGAS